MPTENQKVSAYVEPDLYEALLQYQAKNRIKSLSQALGHLLRATLIEPSSAGLQGGGAADLVARIEKLERAVETLTRKPTVSQSSTAQKVSRETETIVAKPRKTKSRPKVDQSEPLPGGLSQNQLCIQFGIESKNVARKAKSIGLTSQQWMERETGWVFRDGKYYDSVSVS